MMAAVARGGVAPVVTGADRPELVAASASVAGLADDARDPGAAGDGVDLAGPALCVPEVATAEAAGTPAGIATPTDPTAPTAVAESPGADSEATSPDAAQASACD